MSPVRCTLPLALLVAGCARAPSPLAPGLEGSIGLPHRGVLTAPAELPRDAEGVHWLRGNDRHWALPRFADAIARAAVTVAHERPGSPPLVVGDLSVRTGGVLLPHLSHRSGRDADLLLFWTTLEGAPVESPGFVHVGDDGLAWDPAAKRFLRLDVEREWLLVRALVTDPEARIQWIFANHVVEALLLEQAEARGEPADTIFRAERVMLEPNPGGVHDDHVHVRTACTESEVAHGCERSGPAREWLEESTPDEDDDDDDVALVRDLLRPLDAPERVSFATP
jgi:penicillin-insensitive murein endopeptidase